jgi:hypothetical protein
MVINSYYDKLEHVARIIRGHLVETIITEASGQQFLTLVVDKTAGKSV